MSDRLTYDGLRLILEPGRLVLLGDPQELVVELLGARAHITELEEQTGRRVIVDQEELQSLPPGVVVRASDGTIAARFDSEFGVVFGDDRPFPWSVLRAPAVVLWQGEWIDHA